jgi:hypothetical protein
LFISVLRLEIQLSRGRGDPINWFNPLHFCACLKPGPGFQTPLYVMVFFVFNCLRWEMVAHFVGLDEIINHHCSNFLLTTWWTMWYYKVTRCNIWSTNQSDDESCVFVIHYLEYDESCDLLTSHNPHDESYEILTSHMMNHVVNHSLLKQQHQHLSLQVIVNLEWIPGKMDILYKKNPIKI